MILGNVDGRALEISGRELGLVQSHDELVVFSENGMVLWVLLVGGIRVDSLVLCALSDSGLASKAPVAPNWADVESCASSSDLMMTMIRGIVSCPQVDRGQTR